MYIQTNKIFLNAFIIIFIFWWKYSQTVAMVKTLTTLLKRVPNYHLLYALATRVMGWGSSTGATVRSSQLSKECSTMEGSLASLRIEWEETYK